MDCLLLYSLTHDGHLFLTGWYCNQMQDVAQTSIITCTSFYDGFFHM